MSFNTCKSNFVTFLVLSFLLNISCKKEDIRTEDDNALSIILLPTVQTDAIDVNGVPTYVYSLKGQFFSPKKFKIKEYGFRIVNLGGPMTVQEFIPIKEGEMPEAPGTVVGAEYKNQYALNDLVISMYAIKENGDTLKTAGDYNGPMVIPVAGPISITFNIHYAFAVTTWNYNTYDYTISETGYDYSFASTYAGTMTGNYIHEYGPINDDMHYAAIDASSLGSGNIFEQYYYVFYVIVKNKWTGETTKIISEVDTNF